MIEIPSAEASRRLAIIMQRAPQLYDAVLVDAHGAIAAVCCVWWVGDVIEDAGESWTGYVLMPGGGL